MKCDLKQLCERDNLSHELRSVEETYKFLMKNPQLEPLSFLSIQRISNIKSVKRQEQVIENVIALIEHPTISNYRVTKIIRSSKGLI